MTKISGQNLNILRTNRDFKMKNKKTFFIIFKGLSTKQITQFFSEDESPTLIIPATC